MRFAKVLFGALATVAAVACGGNPEGQGEEQAQVQSTLEATGKVEFYVEITTPNGTIVGESTVKGHEKTIAAFRLHMGIGSPHDSASGLATGKTTFDDVTLTNAFDSTDPQLMQALTTNARLTKVTLTFVHENAAGKSVNWQT